jgi:hypothetical protein
MADLIRHLEKRATLIIDAPPLLPVTDAAVLTRLSGGAIMIIATGKTRREQLRTATSNIESVGGKILGLVMNMAPARGPDSHRYGYGYQYDYPSTTNAKKLDDHAPVIPAGLGGMPGVNGSPTPTVPVGRVGAPSKPHEPNSVAEVIEGHMGAPRPASKASVQASAAADGDGTRVASTQAPPAKSAPVSTGPALQSVVPADEKVIGGSAGVPLATATPVVTNAPPELLPADTASGARFGLDDDAPLNGVDEVPVDRTAAEPVATWTPPSPRAALDPLTAPYEEVQVADLRRNSTDERDGS